MEHAPPYEPEESQLSSEELERIAALTPEQIQAIDAALLQRADPRWRKVALLVATAMNGSSHIPGIPDTYYARRIQDLVANGTLEAQGDLSRMRHSEVRLPALDAGNET